MKHVIWAHPVHKPSQEQIKAMGNVKVVYLKDMYPDLAEKLINSPSTAEELYKLAKDTVTLFSAIAVYDGKNIQSVKDFYQVGGSMAFHLALGKVMGELPFTDIKLHYSHSERVSEDKTLPDGSVEKVSIFKFEKWI